MSTPKSQQEFCLRWTNHPGNFIAVFKEILENCAFADVTLVTEDKPTFIRCHKVVLASCSEYFSSLFIDLSSCENNPMIVLKDVRHKEMKALVDYMYQGEVHISQDQLPALLRVAETLQIKGLTDESKLHKKKYREPIDDVHSQYSQSLQSSPPPSITTSTNINDYQNLNTQNGYTSPPLCTSSSYYNNNNNNNNKSPRSSKNLSPRTREKTLMYNNLLVLPSELLQQHQLQQQQQQQQQQQYFAEQHALAQCIAARNTPIFPGYDTNEISLRKQMNLLGLNSVNNRDTPILRTVLGQGHADSSQASNLMHTDNNDTYRSPSNGSANDTNDDRRSSIEQSQIYNNISPQTSDHSLMEDDDKKPISLPTSSSKKAGKQEWKRYKQYSRKNITDAIDAVRTGMSALKAAQLFNVPSRTLYDKVKKLGISTPRPFRRNGNLNNNIANNSSSACFPYGMGGNANGSIYASMSSINDTTTRTTTTTTSSSSSTNIIDNHPTELLETKYSKSRENSTERDTVSPINNQNNDNDNMMDDNDQVEDLSINKKPDVGVIMQALNIKEEKHIPEDFSRR